MATIKLRTSIPGPKSQALMAERVKHVPRGPFHITPIFVEKAKGAVVEDVDGNTLLDFAGGIGVVNTGHANEAVTAAVRAQLERFHHTSFNVMAYEGYVALAARLNKAAPGDFAKKTFLVSTGAEAVENAVKIARAFTGRQAVVCFDHAFHGRTYMAMSLTSKAKPYRVGFGPLAPEVYRAPLPYVYRWPSPAAGDAAKVSAEAFAQFEELVNARVGANQVAAVIFEPVLGEGGFVPFPKEFLKRLREFCTANGIVLIADEIQTGFGRTGTIFASEQLGIVPDLITTAKGLGGGFPISAVTGRAEVMDGPEVSGIGGTFNGNPVSCAAALAVFDLMEKGDILARARAVGETLGKRLAQWKDKYPIIGNVRGLGPMLAMELVKDRATKAPELDAAKKLLKLCYERGVVLMTAGTYGNVVRFLVPLTIEPGQLNEGLDVVEGALREIS
jgi:4-aminobutyrate aminotransferase/(S)-3-amino-2-methylpropionate transaminase